MSSTQEPVEYVYTVRTQDPQLSMVSVEAGDGRSAIPAGPAEVVAGDVSGGANTSHTIVVPALALLLDAVPTDGSFGDYERAVLEGNVLGKATVGARQRTFRYLRELYLLDRGSVLFRGLRDLWPLEPEGRPMLAGLLALARDAVFRASRSVILGTRPGDTVNSQDLAHAVGTAFPGAYKESTLLKIGRNTFSSWEQTGHLEPAGRSTKLRRQAIATPSALTFALFLGHLEGARGAGLFETLWAETLDLPASRLRELASVASQHGLIDLRDAGGVVQVGFSALLRSSAEPVG